MPIVVTCSGCRTRFQVSDQFAGKTGPCPKCKAVIRVPTKEEEVRIKVPEQVVSAGKTIAKKALSEPLARKEFKLSRLQAVMLCGSSLLVVLVAAGGRFLQPSWLKDLLCAGGLLLVSPAIVLAGYGILRDDELEPFRGRSLQLRTGICALAYAALWGIFIFVAARTMTGEVWNWFFIVPPFLVIGALVALACFDFEFGPGFFHYAFYLVLTMFLRLVAGLGWKIWHD